MIDSKYNPWTFALILYPFVLLFILQLLCVLKCLNRSFRSLKSFPSFDRTSILKRWSGIIFHYTKFASVLRSTWSGISEWASFPIKYWWLFKSLNSSIVSWLSDLNGFEPSLKNEIIWTWLMLSHRAHALLKIASKIQIRLALIHHGILVV